MSLQDRLNGCRTKADADRLLASVYVSLKGTEQAEALAILVGSIHKAAMGTILSPSAGPEARAFNSGVVYGAERILTEFQLVINIDVTTIKDEQSFEPEDTFIPKEDPVY